MNKTYCYSWDDERYYGEYDGEEEAIAEAKRDRPDAESVYIGTCTVAELQWQTCEEEIIESIIVNLEDEVGEMAEIFEVETKDELMLAEMVDKTVKEWIEKCGIKSGCFTVLDGHEVSLVKEDTK